MRETLVHGKVSQHRASASSRSPAAFVTVWPVATRRSRDVRSRHDRTALSPGRARRSLARARTDHAPAPPSFMRLPLPDQRRVAPDPRARPRPIRPPRDPAHVVVTRGLAQCRRALESGAGRRVSRARHGGRVAAPAAAQRVAYRLPAVAGTGLYLRCAPTELGLRPISALSGNDPCRKKERWQGPGRGREEWGSPRGSGRVPDADAGIATPDRRSEGKRGWRRRAAGVSWRRRRPVRRACRTW